MKVVYHGGSKKLDILMPLNLHGDPDVDKVVFASPSRDFALAYTGRKWGDKDINQSITGDKSNRKMTLTEMRPGALEDIYKDADGYLYEVPANTFKKIPTRRGSSYEVASKKSVKPISITPIKNVLSELEASDNIVLERYSSSNRTYRNAIERMKRRVFRFDEEKREQYIKWVSSSNESLGRILRNYLINIEV